MAKYRQDHARIHTWNYKSSVVGEGFPSSTSYIENVQWLFTSSSNLYKVPQGLLLYTWFPKILPKKCYKLQITFIYFKIWCSNPLEIPWVNPYDPLEISPCVLLVRYIHGMWVAGNPRGTWPFTAPEAAWPCGQPWDLAKADVTWRHLHVEALVCLRILFMHKNVTFFHVSNFWIHHEKQTNLLGNGQKTSQKTWRW